MPNHRLVDSLAYAEVVHARPSRKRQRPADKVCRYCKETYQVRQHEHPRRDYCYRPGCENLRDHEAGVARRRKGPLSSPRPKPVDPV